MIKILIVEDDVDLNQAVCKHLSNKGYQVEACLDANEALEKMGSWQFDLIISDIMMPEMDGYEFAEAVRLENKDIPILFMSARDDYNSKERGFRLGIDDYLVKPFDLNEMVLRIEALLRRANIATEKKLVIGNLVLDEEDMSASVDGEQVVLTLREFQILFKLLSTPKHVFTRSQLMEEFSGGVVIIIYCGAFSGKSCCAISFRFAGF